MEFTNNKTFADVFNEMKSNLVPTIESTFSETLNKMKLIFPDKDFTPRETEYKEPTIEDIECVPQLTRSELLQKMLNFSIIKK